MEKVVTRAPTVKERILLHLFDHRPTGGYEAPAEITQRGIARAVGIRLRHVSQYVKPLIEQEILERRSTHIRGRRRSQFAYELTPLGRRQATGLRTALLQREVPFRRSSGRLEELPLSSIYHGDRHGATILELLQEFRAAGYVSETKDERDVRDPEIVDFGPRVPEGDPFLGREKELKELAESLDRTPLTMVWGIAGIGKTTLGARVCDSLRGRRSIFWHRIRPWDTVMDLALDLAGFLKAQGLGELQVYLGRQGAQNLTRIGEIMGSALGDTPALLVLDDVHKASSEGKAFLSVLFQALRSQQVTSAMVLTREVPDFYPRESVSLDENVTELLLKGLEPQSGAALLLEAGVGESFLERILKQAGGNPLLLRLLAKGASQTDSLDAWSSVEAYIAREVEPRLNDEERDCLELASFYEIPVLRKGLLLGRTGGSRTIVGLLAKALLEEVEGSRFQAHDVLRNYFQAGMPLGRGEDLTDVIVPWLWEEADRALKSGEPQQAISLLENAAAIDRDPVRRSEGLEQLGHAREVTADMPGAREAFQRARTEFSTPTDRARLHWKIAHTFLYLFQLDEAAREIERGLEVVPSGPSVDSAQLLVARQVLRWVERDHEGSFADLETVEGWLPNLPEDPELIGRWAFEMASHYLYDPRRRNPTEAVRYCEKSIRAFEGIGAGHLWGPLLVSAQASFVLGDADDALALVERGLKVGRDSGSVLGPCYALFIKARILMDCRGEFQVAAELLEEARKVLKAVHQTYRLGWFPRHFADLYWYQGRTEEAMESLEHFLSISGDGLASESQIESLTRLARLSAELGDAGAANAYLAQAREVRSEGSHPASEYFIEWAAATVLALEGDHQGAEAGFQSAMALPTPGPHGETVQEFLATGANEGELLLDYGRFLASMGDRNAAREYLSQSQEIFSDLSREPLEKLASQALAIADAPPIPQTIAEG